MADSARCDGRLDLHDFLVQHQRAARPAAGGVVKSDRGGARGSVMGGAMRSRAMLGIAALAGMLATVGAGAGMPAASSAAAGPRVRAARPEPLGYRVLHQDIIINADIWNRKPEMMAAGLGFTGIVGVPNLSTSDVILSKTLTVLAGGTWNTVRCAPGQTPALNNYTSASTPSGVDRTRFGGHPA